MPSDWGEYYSQRGVSVGRMLGNLAAHRELFEAILALKPKKILEVGSGSGSMCTFLSWLGYDVLSVDNDKRVLADAAEFTKKLNGRCRYAYADAFVLSDALHGEKFDIAFSQGFFEHFSDVQIEKLVDEQLKVAEHVVFSMPSYYYPHLDFGNERLMRLEQWRSILAKYNILSLVSYSPRLRGIKGLLVDLFTRPWKFLPWRQRAHLLVVLTAKK